MNYRILEKGEIVQEGDECDAATGWNDEAKWVPAKCIGEQAPDPKYPAHRIYRRKIGEEMSIEKLCIDAAIAMQNLHIARHEQFVNCQDTDTESSTVKEWPSNKLIKVTIDWVEETGIAGCAIEGLRHA